MCEFIQDIGIREPGPGELLNRVKDKPKVVCLCGSGRFMKEFNIAEKNETLSGNIVLTIGLNTSDVARDKLLLKYKPMLDKLHTKKIDISDEILVINKDGYIGESTRKEISYAQGAKKKIRYWC